MKKKRDIERSIRVVEITSMVIIPDKKQTSKNFVPANRRFIREGDIQILKKKKKLRYVFLFNDSLLITKKISDKKFEFVLSFDLLDARLESGVKYNGEDSIQVTNHYQQINFIDDPQNPWKIDVLNIIQDISKKKIKCTSKSRLNSKGKCYQIFFP